MTASYFNLGAAAAVCLATILGIVAYKKWKQVPVRFVKVGKVSKLFFYPVKAFAANEVSTLECAETGVRVGAIHDRMWTVVDDKAQCIDQKEVPRFVLLHARLEEDRMCIDGPGMDTLELKVFDEIGDQEKVIRINVFDREIDSVDCGEDAAQWIQKFSGKSGYRIVQYVPGSKPRASDMKGGVCKLRGEDFPLIFQADQPVLILSEASVEDLNTRVKEKVTHLNFRPNILVEGCEAFNEDKWKYVRIGETTTLMKTLACNRCAITTTNVKTGGRGMEPLATLRKFRLAVKPQERAVFKYSPLFGMYFGIKVKGRVSVGDEVYAVYE